MNHKKTAIITGITGQDGAYLSKLLLSKGYSVIGLVRKNFKENTTGLQYLNILEDIRILECNLLVLDEIKNIFDEYRPDEVYNLAAQSSVSLSFEKPLETIQFNILSVVNLLEAIKTVNIKIKFYQASSSDMFGNTDVLPITEKSIIHPTSPYAISKATGHWTAINYRESYGIFASCGILFNHESYLRTENFFVKKVIRTAIEIKQGKAEELRVGNIDLSRDFGYAPDYVRAMWLMLQQKKAGEYLICSGRSISLREIVEYVFDKVRISKNKIIIDEKLFRPNDIENIYGTNEKARLELGWEYDKAFCEVLDVLIDEEFNKK